MEVAVSEHDRRRWDRQVAALLLAENEDSGTPQWRADVISWADQERAVAGTEALATETEFYRYAESLGLRRAVS